MKFFYKISCLKNKHNFYLRMTKYCNYGNIIQKNNSKHSYYGLLNPKPNSLPFCSSSPKLESGNPVNRTSPRNQ